MRVIVITNPEQTIPNWPTFGPRVLDPEEQETCPTCSKERSLRK